MSRHDVVIVKDTHRGLLYEDGVFREVLPAGRYLIPAQPSRLALFFGARSVRSDVVLVDVRSRDRTVVVQDFLTADGATITASFALQYRVIDPRVALHEVKSFEDRVVAETQTAARRLLRGMSLDEILGSRDEIGEELLCQVAGTAGSYGLEVSALDLKDLAVPPEIREEKNRAAMARRSRQRQLAGSFPADEAEQFPHAYDPGSETGEDEDELDAPNLSGRHRLGPKETDRFLVRRPEDQGFSTPKRVVTGFDPSLRRFRI